MEIVIILIAILLLSRVKNVNDAVEFRVVVGSIMLITYLVIWPYVNYIAQLLLSETYVYISYLVLLTVAMVIVVLISMIRINVFIPAFSISLLLIMWFFSYAFDVKIKNRLANFTGYFNADVIITEKLSDVKYRNYQSTVGAYTVSIPVQWKQKVHKASGLTYFKTELNNNIEFRPKCFQPVKQSMSEIVNQLVLNIDKKETVITQCYHWNDDGYACKLQISINENPIRVRWFATRPATGHAIDLDFVLQDQREANLKLIDSVISSVSLNQFTLPVNSCVSVTEWY